MASHWRVPWRVAELTSDDCSQSRTITIADQRFNTLLTQQFLHDMETCFHRPPSIRRSLQMVPSRSPPARGALSLNSADVIASNRHPVRRNLFGTRHSDFLPTSASPPERLAAGLPIDEHPLCPTDQSDAAQPTLLASASNDAASSCASQVVAFIVARLSLSREQAVQPGLDADLLRIVLRLTRDQGSGAELQSSEAVELLAHFLHTQYPVKVRQVRAGFTLTVLPSSARQMSMSVFSSHLTCKVHCSHSFPSSFHQITIASSIWALRWASVKHDLHLGV